MGKMLKGVVVAYCKCRRFIAEQKIHPWRQPTLNFFNNSTASFASSSSKTTPSLHNYYIRKRRKWPIQPFNKQLPQFFASQLAKKCFKQSIEKSKAHLLPDLINAFAAYETQPSPQSYHFLFKVLIQSRPSNFHDQILQVLDHVEKVEEFETPGCIIVDLIKFYGDLNMFDEAVELFSRVPRFRCEPSIEILNALLSVLCKNEKGSEIVPTVLFKSQEMNIRIEESTFAILIRALCRNGNAVKALELLNQMAEEGFDLDEKLCSLILATMCRRRDCSGSEVLLFLEELKRLGFEPRMDDFMNVIRVLAKMGKGVEALRLLKQMRMNRVNANVAIYNLVLAALITVNEFTLADKVFDEMLVLGLVPDINTYNLYINGLCLQGKVEDGIAMLHSIEELGCAPDTNTYRVILRALCEAGEVGRVREMVDEMQLKCRRLDQEMYEIVIAGFVRNGDVEGACSLIDEMVGENVTIHRSESLDGMMCWLWKAGLHSLAEELLQK